MDKEGKYIYCIVGTEGERNFGPIGIGGRKDEVVAIGYENIGMVVSNHPMTKFVVNRENMLGHQRVIEEVMKEFDSVLPVRFGTVASSADEIRNLLDRRYREFKSLLRTMDYKVELGVKGIWKNMKIIFKEIDEENKLGRSGPLTRHSLNLSIQTKIGIGKLVEQALAKKKEKEADKIVDALRKASFDYKLNKTVTDEMFINAAFLVDKGQKEFDNTMEDLSERYKDRIKFMYAGPMPPYNFVNITIYPEEWEK